MVFSAISIRYNYYSPPLCLLLNHSKVIEKLCIYMVKNIFSTRYFYEIIFLTEVSTELFLLTSAYNLAFFEISYEPVYPQIICVNVCGHSFLYKLHWFFLGKSYWFLKLPYLCWNLSKVISLILIAEDNEIEVYLSKAWEVAAEGQVVGRAATMETVLSAMKVRRGQQILNLKSQFEKLVKPLPQTGERRKAWN